MINNKNTPDWWARFFGIAAFVISCITFYYQFLNYTHDLTANIRNLDSQSDSIYFEAILINNGDFDEIIKTGGFVYRTGNLKNQRKQRELKFNEIRIQKGEKMIISLAHPNFDINNLWQLGITNKDSSHTIEIYFYLKTIDNLGRDVLCETKIGQVIVEADTTKWIDETPILMNLVDPKTTKKISNN